MDDIEREAEEAVDPGEPEAVASTEDGAGASFPDAQIIMDENTGQYFLAFEIDPADIQGEEGDGGGDEGKEG